ncbi:MAG: hypothetical protein OSJ62_09905 [Lachnospiraceae bacterium]|nr:hypothetical protein [Lachnospiraceae bacterium]
MREKFGCESEGIGGRMLERGRGERWSGEGEDARVGKGRTLEWESHFFPLFRSAESKNV